MLSFNNHGKNSIPIAEDYRGTLNKPRIVYVKDDNSNDDLSEIDTTEANKKKIFRDFLMLDRKLKMMDIEKICSRNVQGNAKLERKLLEADEFVQKSLKTYMSDPEADFFPLIKEKSFRMFVSGLSGSGKTTFIANFIKHNLRKRDIFLISPVEDDEVYRNIKNITRIYEPISEIELLENSVVIFDDIESYDDRDELRDMLYFRNIILERGRHLDISCFCVSHNPMNNNATKQCLRECQYYVLFPKFNLRDSKVLLKRYGCFQDDEINQIISQDSRWALLKKSVPRYLVTQHSIMTF